MTCLWLRFWLCNKAKLCCVDLALQNIGVQLWINELRHTFMLISYFFLLYNSGNHSCHFFDSVILKIEVRHESRKVRIVGYYLLISDYLFTHVWVSCNSALTTTKMQVHIMWLWKKSRYELVIARKSLFLNTKILLQDRKTHILAAWLQLSHIWGQQWLPLLFLI